MNTKNYFKVAAILLAYPLAHFYVREIITFSHENATLKRIIFVLLFALWNELIIRGRGKAPHKITYIWYGIMTAVAATSVTGLNEEVSMLGLHLCAVYVALLSNGILLEGRTGSFIVSDLFNGFILKPFPGFGNIFVDIKSLFRSRKESAADTAKKKGGISAAIGFLVVILMIPVFIIAVLLLGEINKEFGSAVSGILNSIAGIFNIRWILENMGIAFFAIPACLYLYGMLSKCADSDGVRERRRCEALTRFRTVCRKVSPLVSVFVTGCFVLLYLSFFVFEARYLFSAFAGRLPVEFTAAEYARRGFFELTGIMFINMLIFLAISYFENREAIGRKLSGFMIISLMAESIVFSVISFSKLALYYSRFGYTPKRLLAIWGTLIFAAGAILVIVSRIRRKDLSREWIYFTVFSFALLNILSSILSLTIGGIYE